MFLDCINKINRNQTELDKTTKAIEYFEKCFKDIQENPNYYEQGAYESTDMALTVLKKYKEELTR